MLSSRITPERTVALRGPWLTLTDDPFTVPWRDAYRYESDGVIVARGGRIVAAGPADTVLPGLRGPYELEDLRGGDHLILPGFIDCHVHYPQMGVIASYGTQLIEWLERYTFPAEEALADPAVARATARVFLREMLRAGTTAAAVFGTVHPHSADVLFEESAALDLCLLAGKVMMDRNAPPALRDTPESAHDDSRRLIERWHGHGRLRYALTPRFAPTSTPEQLEAVGALRGAFPDVHVQSHLSENTDEIRWVRELFPERKDYLDVYAHYGLTGRRSVYGHCIHLTDREWAAMREDGTSIACCPTSNLFIGSGLFDLRRAKMEGAPVPVGLATDVGGGTSMSLLRTLNLSYKVAQLRGLSLHPMQGLHLMTRGAAEALDLAGEIGSIAPGMMADLTVLDMRSTPLIDFRMDRVSDIAEAFFTQMIMADDRAVHSTWVAGRPVHRRDGAVDVSLWRDA